MVKYVKVYNLTMSPFLISPHRSREQGEKTTWKNQQKNTVKKKTAEKDRKQ
jgi:hypothetical protein